jgi:transcriptional regulator with XRE-family HTH domain
MAGLPPGGGSPPFGQELRGKRKEKGITQKHLAEKAGVTAAYIGQIERGERAGSAATRARLCLLCGIPVDRVLGGVMRGAGAAYVAASPQYYVGDGGAPALTEGQREMLQAADGMGEEDRQYLAGFIRWARGLKA